MGAGPQAGGAVKQRGFTLLEAMVTIVILAMVFALLMQALVQVLGLRERVLRHERDARVAALHERWFRESVGAALADLPRFGPPFSGDASGFRLVTAEAPRTSTFGVVRWRAMPSPRGLRLELVEERGEWAVLAPGLDTIRFAYLDARGEWHTSWPQPSQPGELLPRAVRLAAEGQGERWHWQVPIAAAATLPPVLAAWEEVADGLP